MLGAMTTIAPPRPVDAGVLCREYLAAWEARDPDRIASLHSEDSSFTVHWGEDPRPAVGRDAVREAFAANFERWPAFDFETNRVLVGDRHWVLDWTMFAAPAGEPVEVGLLDVVVVGRDGLVARKDTYLAAAGQAS
jgi:uncharacterized protein (TIGR02246 family)